MNRFLFLYLHAQEECMLLLLPPSLPDEQVPRLLHILPRQHPLHAVFVAAAAALTTAACNTISGVGRDTQAAGKAVTECAQGQTC